MNIMIDSDIGSFASSIEDLDNIFISYCVKYALVWSLFMLWPSLWLASRHNHIDATIMICIMNMAVLLPK